MSTTVKDTKLGKPCGFCTTGDRHDLCPGGILNGNGREVVLCGCTEHELVRRCLDCNLRSNEAVDEATWQCTDQDSCAARRAKAREKSLVALYGSADTENPLRAVPRTEKPEKAPSKPKTGTCLCCGETTGGGLFRPGHDSKYLTRCVASIKENPNPQVALDLALLVWSNQGISEALQGKLRKRVA
ncbi:hypothetical protein SEA_MILANI_35 [Microbacterium phage Milani]|nr:hypothetical protein SEA_MILANI_35 [Microbacterium phage Milani]